MANVDALTSVTMVNSFASQWALRRAGILSEHENRATVRTYLCVPLKVRRVGMLRECEQSLLGNSSYENLEFLLGICSREIQSSHSLSAAVSHVC